MRILQIVIKNTSTMDFSVPALRLIKRENPNVNVTVLYCVMDRRNILRKSTFWDQIFEECGVIQVDYCDYLKWPWRLFKGFFRWIFSGSKYDKIHIHEIWEFYLRNSKNPSKISFILFLFKEYGFFGLVANFSQSAVSFIEKKVVKLLVDIDAILPRLMPDVILFDNRALSYFPGRHEIYQWMYQNKVKVGLLPHAPHLRDPLSEFCPFDECGEPLPDFCEFWVPLKFGKPWLVIPERKTQFHLTGYPGLDSKWLSWCRDGMGRGSNVRKSNETLNCLFVMRRYLPMGEVRPHGVDPYIVNFEDFYENLKSVLEAFEKLGLNIKLILKPHPANNYKILAADLERMGVKNWEISHESIYSILSHVDLVIGIFSTVLLIPAMAGIPTVLIRTNLQNIVHSEWPLLKEIYAGMPYYVDDINKLPEILDLAVRSLDTASNDSEIRRLRSYYEDYSSEYISKRILS